MSPMLGTAKTTYLVLQAARVAGWVLAFSILVLSIVPAPLRPETGLPSHLEHFGIFGLAGVVFAYGYGRRLLLVAFALVAFSGLVEFLQLFAPGRHARISDLVVDAASACVGIVLASSLGARALEESALHGPRR
jgi:VanZ family protein